MFSCSPTRDQAEALFLGLARQKSIFPQSCEEFCCCPKHRAKVSEAHHTSISPLTLLPVLIQCCFPVSCLGSFPSRGFVCIIFHSLVLQCTGLLPFLPTQLSFPHLLMTLIFHCGTVRLLFSVQLVCVGLTPTYTSHAYACDLGLAY